MAHGTEVAHQRMFEQELLLGMTIGALGAGALTVDRLIERASAIEGDPHLRPGFPVQVFDAAFALFELFIRTAFSSGLGKEQGTAKALSAVAVGVGEVVRWMHAQPNGAQGHAIRSTLTVRMTMGVEGNGGNAAAQDHRLIDVPGIKSSI